MNGINLKVAAIVFFSVLVLIAVIISIIANVKRKRMMRDGRLKNAKQFAVYSTSVAISPDGFIGVASLLKTVIFNIKDIGGFCIVFYGASVVSAGFSNIEERKVENDAGTLLFNNIILKVEPELKNKVREVKMQINMKDISLVNITLLQGNSHYNKKGRVTKETVLNIPEKKQGEIKEFLSALENVEKQVKG